MDEIIKMLAKDAEAKSQRFQMLGMQNVYGLDMVARLKQRDAYERARKEWLEAEAALKAVILPPANY